MSGRDLGANALRRHYERGAERAKRSQSRKGSSVKSSVSSEEELRPSGWLYKRTVRQAKLVQSNRYSILSGQREPPGRNERGRIRR